MAGITGTAQLGDLVNQIRARAIHTMLDYGVFPGVNDRVSVPKGTRSYTEPKIAAVSAYELSEGVDMAQAQALSDSLLTVTPVEYGVQVIYTKLAQVTRSEAIVPLITRAITDALKKKQDTVGTEQMDNFSTALGSGSGTTLTRGYLGASMARIRGNATEISNDPVVCVVHPFTYNDLVDQVADGTLTTSGWAATGLAGAPEDFARKYVVGRFANMPIMTDSNIAVSSNAAKGGVFTKEAIVYAELWPIDIEPEKDASLRATELNGTMCFAYGERTDTWGVELNLGATAPTS